MTEAELLAEFRALFNWNGDAKLTPAQFCREHGFSKSYISQVLNGKRSIGPKLAAALGYAPSFERIG